MNFPTDRRYTAEHEWAQKDGQHVVVGVTKYAQESLGDVVYVELPKVGDKVTKGQPFGVVESTKAVSELFAPVSGTIVGVNDPISEAPESINADPHGKAWLIRIDPSDAAEFDALLDAPAYEKLVAEAAH